MKVAIALLAAFGLFDDLAGHLHRAPDARGYDQWVDPGTGLL